MTDDVTKLRELAEAINGIRPMPFASADLCRRVANEMELANARIDSLLDSLQKAQTALAEFTAEIERLRAIVAADDEYIAAWDRFAFVCVPRGCGKTQLAAARERCVKARQAAEAGGDNAV